MLRVFNDTARYVDQGGGERKGAFAVYLEPWHADSFEFLDLRKNHGKGILQTDMWGVTPSNRWDWNALRDSIVRNSLLVAPMPTASTSEIFGNNECFEPYTSNIYSRRVLSPQAPFSFIISVGLKTRMYYLTSRAAADAIKFTVDTSMLKEKPKVEDDETKMAQMVIEKSVGANWFLF
ncbi:hypothetical protein V6N13_126763 [Hibiscus sabdariffa]